jgi:uncharacterized membrane protein YsdA (DUF1294 family)
MGIKMFIYYYLLVNLTSFILMGRDKSLARRGRWRIPEAWFFILALIGGALGVWFGMKYFHHKTKHNRFVYGIPLVLILNMALIFAFGLKLN